MTVKELEGALDEFKADVDNKFTSLGDRLTKLTQTIDANSKSVKDDLLGIRSAIINNLLQENRKIRSKNYELENRVVVLEDRLADVEKQVNQTEQNNRKNNIEIEGIPDNIRLDALPEVIVKIVNFLTDENISVSDVEDCHRLRSRIKPKPTIVRMKRNILMKVKKNAKNLKGIDTALDFPRGTQLFIRDNQSPNMKSLAYNARLLKQNGLIEDTWFWNAAVHIKTADEQYHKITHETDLHRLFKDFKDFTFDRDFCSRILYENPDFHELKKLDDLDGAWCDFIESDEAARGVEVSKHIERMLLFTE